MELLSESDWEDDEEELDDEDEDDEELEPDSEDEIPTISKDRRASTSCLRTSSWVDLKRPRSFCWYWTGHFPKRRCSFMLKVFSQLLSILPPVVDGSSDCCSKMKWNWVTVARKMFLAHRGVPSWTWMEATFWLTTVISTGVSRM